MSIFFTSDLHIGHVNLAEQWRRGPAFDGTVPTHNAVIRERWNDTVRPGDEVYIVGDAVMGDRTVNIPWIAENLHGRKFLIPGNHDNVHPMFSAEKIARFTPVYAQAFEVLGVTVRGARFDLYDVVFTHFPWLGTADHEGAERHYDTSRWAPNRKNYTADTVVVHGHTHASEVLGDHAVHVGVDAHDFTPISLDHLTTFIQQARSTAP